MDCNVILCDGQGASHIILVTAIIILYLLCCNTNTTRFGYCGSTKAHDQFVLQQGYDNNNHTEPNGSVATTVTAESERLSLGSIKTAECIAYDSTGVQLDERDEGNEIYETVY